jgi:lysophospholipase L1-like esterase
MSKEKNYHTQPLPFALLVFLLLAGLSLLPEGMSLAGFPLRKMDIFSDIRDSVALAAAPPKEETFAPDTSALAAGDTLAVPNDSTQLLAGDSSLFAPLPAADSVVFGKIIEDYTPGQQGLRAFFQAVDSIRHGRTVRVAWYGDSFVEGDILIGDLRDTLQTLWGGAGVGFVPITSEVAQFKRSLKHNFRGWTAFSIVKKSETRPPLGLNGYAYRPEAEAKVHYEGTRYFRNTQRWNNVKLFYTAPEERNFVWQAAGEAPHEEKLKGRGDRLAVWKWRGNSTDGFAIRFPETAGLLAYGVTLENGPGIYVDNFSVRGNSGGPLKLLAPDFIRQFDAEQQYDLIVLQVGLNAVTNTLNNIRWYEAELERTFRHLKACFPGKPVLIVSVGDRGGKTGDELTTMRGVPAIVAMQRNLARKHGFLFYDLFHGMGGPNTMIRFAYQRPRLANTDYTHLTHDGGKAVGWMFAGVLLQEQQRFRTKRTQ